jgi:hypothetical protein
MNKVYDPIFDDASLGWQVNRSLRTGNADSSAAISDSRVARLLLVLRELDERVDGLEYLPKRELSELVSGAIGACGFTDPVEARSAIAAVLQAFEAPDLPEPLQS